MTEDSKRMLLAGFWKQAYTAEFARLSETELKEKVNAMASDEAEKYADEHEVEVSVRQLMKTPYPKPILCYHLIWETFQRPVEGFYFWSLEQFSDLGFPVVEKLTDIFTASEHSSFYGAAQQRIGFHQEKVAQFLRGISDLVKGLFQITRELRIIDERAAYYEDAESSNPDIRDPAEIALKGLFIDFAEGGAKNPGSVYGLARELQFTTLPDLFFSIHPKTEEEIGKLTKELAEGFNRKVIEVLTRKLYQYLKWKKATHHELHERREHTIKYLRQHYDVIELYMNWVKPYLKQIKRLTMDQRKLETPELIAAFEGSVVEIELMARTLPENNTDYYAVIIYNMLYRTSPTLPFTQDYQRGPLHMGKADIFWRCYIWNEKTIQKFHALKKLEDLDLISTIDVSIRESMDKLGDSLKKYLAEAGEKFTAQKEVKKEEEEKHALVRGVFEPFTALAKNITGMKESFSKSMAELKEALKIEAIIPSAKKGKEGLRIKSEQARALGAAKALCWLHYRNFKKAHGLVTW